VSPQLRLPPTLAARVTRFDDAVDGIVEGRLRGRSVLDRVFYGASAAGDHGLVWMGLAGVQALRHRRDDWPRPLARAVVGLAAESALVNGPVKWMFRRERPVHVGPRPLHLRRPRTSSFPSGHASAAFFGAALLRDGEPGTGTRLHVRIHHASDVVGGVVVGTLLGELTRRLVPVPGSPSGTRIGDSSTSAS
jgi:undecaprenyl-diphosphatase